MADENMSMVKSIRIGVPPPKPRSPPPSPSSSAPPPNPRTRCNHSKDCCSLRFLLQNHTNFDRSAPPTRFMSYGTRFMSYQNDSWLDFSNEVLQKIQLGFLERKPVIQVLIDGSEFVFDFKRMLQINIMTAKHRSIAWIDENGKCFFPKMVVGDDFEDFAENPEIEIEIKIDG